MKRFKVWITGFASGVMSLVLVSCASAEVPKGNQLYLKAITAIESGDLDTVKRLVLEKKIIFEEQSGAEKNYSYTDLIEFVRGYQIISIYFNIDNTFTVWHHPTKKAECSGDAEPAFIRKTIKFSHSNGRLSLKLMPDFGECVPRPPVFVPVKPIR